LCYSGKPWIITGNEDLLGKGRLLMKETINGITVRKMFSKNLKRLRTIANLSQVNLAVEANLTHNFINDIENGKKWISPETLGKLATALKAEPYQFFISDSKWNDRGAEMFGLYLSDFHDSFEKMVEEYRDRFRLDNKEDIKRN
jgi:transcriptional regulator with XRE-family HTH domain